MAFIKDSCETTGRSGHKRTLGVEIGKQAPGPEVLWIHIWDTSAQSIQFIEDLNHAVWQQSGRPIISDERVATHLTDAVNQHTMHNHRCTIWKVDKYPSQTHAEWTT